MPGLTRDDLTSILVATVLTYSLVVVLSSGVILVRTLSGTPQGLVSAIAVAGLVFYGAYRLNKLTVECRNFPERFLLWVVFLILTPATLEMVCSNRCGALPVFMTLYLLATPFYLGGLPGVKA